MKVERIESEGLAHFSYLVVEGPRAFLVDPRRDCEVYIERARQEHADITHVFETHRNEDYVIGSQEVAERTGARILHGPGLPWGYGDVLEEGQVVPFGKIEVKALHTPGHTEESMCYVLYDRDTGNEAVAAFTGDTLFVGDVGRTDLPGPEKKEGLSHALFRSIHEKLVPLGDGCLVLPAHGAGSVCGGDISERPFSTIGLERIQNPLLQLGEREFVRAKMEQRMDRPPYFRRMEELNLSRRLVLSGLPDPKPLPPKNFQEAMAAGALVLDTRQPHSFAGAYIKNAMSIWLDGLPIYAGWMLPYHSPLLLVVEDPLQVERAVRILVRLGYDNVIGHLRGGMVAWCRAGMPFERLPTMTVEELSEALAKGEAFLLDPRPGHEWDVERVEGALHIFVGELLDRVDEVPRDRLVACMCSGGFRGGMAAALLQDRGHAWVRNVLGGLAAWRAVGYPVQE